MRLARFLSFCLFLANVTVALSATAIIDRPERANFRCCYLTPENPSLCNYAILYKGLEVEIVGGSKETRFKVRVPVDSSKVVVVDGWSGRPDAEGIGWVSPRFVQVKEEATDDNTVTGDVGLLDVNTGNVENTSPNSNVTLGEGDNTSAGETGDDTANDGESVIQGEASDKAGIYYIFAGMGESQEYFFNLVQNGGTAGRSNYVWQYIRRDIKETGKVCKGVVIVKANSPADMYKILSEARVPADGPTQLDHRGRFPIYAFTDLAKSKYNILGFCTVSHSGQDGPLVRYGSNKGLQFSTELMMTDYTIYKLSDTHETIYNRILDNPRFTFCGCNIGHCQYYDMENTSFGHGVAAVYNAKDAVVRAKWSSGPVNAGAKDFATYAKDDKGIVRRLTPHKKDYRLLINVPTNRYDTYNVPFSSNEEKQAILDYYKARDITVKVRSRYITVRSPSWLRGKWIDYAADKDNLLESALLAMANREGPEDYSDEAFADWVEKAQVTPELAEAQKMMPRLKALFNDPLVQLAIERSKEANGGEFDIHDYRVWLAVYYGDKSAEELRNIRSMVPLRACICDDEELTNKFK